MINLWVIPPIIILLFLPAMHFFCKSQNWYSKVQYLVRKYWITIYLFYIISITVFSSLLGNTLYDITSNVNNYFTYSSMFPIIFMIWTF